MKLVRSIFILLGLAFVLTGADPASVPLRGKLIQQESQPPAIEAGGKQIILEGDEPTLKVLNDSRLNNSDFEALGHFNGANRFAVDHIHLKSLFVYRGGKRLQVSYWCDVCYIRTSSPGKCWCCQKNTDLDLIEPEH